VLVRGRRETLFYTGDVSFHDQTLLRGARFDEIQADVLLIETTRGNRATPAGFTREAEADRLAEAIRGALRRKGSVLIPAFALGRTQEILGLLALLMHSGRIRRQAVYIGGLGRVFTEIYDLEAHRTHRQHSDLMLREALNLVVLDRNQLEHMRLTGGRLFVLTSGMMAENTAAHDLALRLMGDERHAIFFVGYADPDTPGGHLKSSRPGERFAFSRQADAVVRQCELREFDLTAHANREEMLDFVGRVAPRTVVLGHGEPSAQDWFETAIRERFPKMKILRPGPGESAEPLPHG
jgi:Cft2 family RNA processing exonuclease